MDPLHPGLPTDDAQRLALLAAAGELLASSLDYQQTLQHVATLSVPALGDLCIVDVLEDGHLRRLATAHVVEAKAALVAELARLRPMVEGSPAPAGRVLASGQTEWLEVVTAEVIATHTADAQHARLIRAIDMRSHVAVPMRARGAIVGVISIGITESDRRFTRQDVDLAEELARRAAMAVDNARLYRSAQDELERRRQAEGALQLSERRFRAILEQSPLSMQRFSPDGRTIGVNRAWTRLWGITLEELSGYNVLEDPQLAAAGISTLLRRAFDGESVELPTIAYDPEQTLPGRRDNAVRWVRAYAYPVRGPDGQIEEVVLLHQDVTDERRAEQRLQDSEERLQRALSIGRITVWDWDLVADTVTCSENAREVWGIDVGSTADFLAVVHPDDVAMTQASAAEAMRTGEPYQMTYRLCPPDGPLRWVTSRGVVEFAADGTAVRILGMTMDITGQKRAEDIARMLADAGRTLGSSLDYATTLASLAEVVVPTIADWYAIDLVTPEGDLERVSVFHPDPAKVALARELHRSYPPPRDAAWGPWAVIDSGRPDWAAEISDAQLVASARDDTHLAMLRQLALRSYVRLPLVARGAAIGLLTLVFAESGRHYSESDIAPTLDLARRAAVAVDNARLLQQLQLADRRKDEFLAMLAHELRNPLAPISTAAQLLRMSAGDDARVQAASQVISRQVAHMAELVDDLLDVSRVTRGLIELERAPVDLQSVVAAAVEQVQPMMQSRSNTLTLHSASEGMVIDGDRARLVQVVSNLLGNASKYSPPGGVIDLRMDRDGDRIRLVVSDAGAGIDPALLPEVFELFTQGHRSPDRIQGGLGIGLALVRRIVELHGGHVTAQSPGVGQGSTFTVLLPAAAVPSAALPTPAADTPRDAVVRRILVVDDNADAADVLAEVLRLEGHAVDVAYTAGDALVLARTAAGAAANFDLCILDIGLPDMTGYALAGLLRATAGVPIPVLAALTGYGQPEDRKASQDSGFDHHLVKPADVRQLRELLAAIPSRSATRPTSTNATPRSGV